MGIFSSKQKSETNQEQSKDEFVGSTISFALIVVLVFAFKSSILDANNIPSGSMIPTLKIGDFLFVNKMRYSFRMPFTEKELIRYDDPKRGDIITFIPPDYALFSEGSNSGLFPKRFVKRVIGLPGDTIRINRSDLEIPGRGIVNYAKIEFKEAGKSEFENYNPRSVPIGDELSDLDNIGASARSLFVEKKRDFEHFVLEGSEDDRRGSMGGYNCNFDEGCLIPEGHYMVMGDNRDDSSDSRVWGFVPREDILGKALILYFSIDWKDSTCEYVDGSELAEVGKELAKRYDGDALFNRCHPSEIYSSRGSEHESRFGWIERTLRYRLWRMEVRWKRIGRLLQ
ncbi:signal peptidase I [Leptospira ryugenii]|uniref:Signal peptidase I n=1 Tax=Leptospira ryugenii TaxID=1917863 RepID=A0A2P2E101_9LEPT|nr:signal peptidase I [Leptospira ryugenii]GBF50568.1 signal peptidase I [Leptospira ryugenii]